MDKRPTPFSNTAGRIICAWVCILCFLLIANPLYAARLFGSSEERHENLKSFPKWTGVLDRYFSDRKLEDKPCSETKFNQCHLQEWKAFLKTLEGKDIMVQMREVNSYMNAHAYVIDPVNWGVPDYWASPKQFLIKDGDCEDYAIAKYMSLRALGFPPSKMRIVVLNDMNLNALHAILAVYINDDIYILDNQIKQVTPSRRIVHYKPVYSINEDYWWRHKN
ncbi:MAG: hypothetical protein EB060_08380 [Proteobacteria bacterium]|nr:hypothetical protein [Pseudomonadota bacterium]